MWHPLLGTTVFQGPCLPIDSKRITHFQNKKAPDFADLKHPLRCNSSRIMRISPVLETTILPTDVFVSENDFFAKIVVHFIMIYKPIDEWSSL